MKSYSKWTNEELLKAYADLDHHAFNEFFHRNAPGILSFLATKLQSKSDAEEALQETFLKIHKHILGYDANQNAMSWVFSIAKNCAFDVFEKRKKINNISNSLKSHNYTDFGDCDYISEAKDKLNTFLGILTDREREIIEDRFLKNISYEILARKHNTSEAGMRQRISRLLRRIRT